MASSSFPSRDNRNQIAVVMVPLPLHGHLNQLLQFSRVITSHNIPVHYVCTPTQTKHVKIRVQGWDPISTSNFHFHEVPIHEFACPPPDPYAENKFPSHLIPLMKATSDLRHPLANFLRSLTETHRRVVVVHDSMVAYALQDVGSIPNCESYVFHPLSVYWTFFRSWVGWGKPFPVEEYEPIEDCWTQEIDDFLQSQIPYLWACSGYIFNSTRVIEGKYLALTEKLTAQLKKPYWALGPFNPVQLSKGNDKGDGRLECLKWLDKQEKNSVIFVSFGTTTSLPDEQIKELAFGLEKSGLKFIWVIRDADRGDLDMDQSRKAQLPDGFEVRIQEKGLIMRDWAPQLDILAHEAVGGFLSHCGWNSCMESISMGVPIATWPMHSDQPSNAKLLTEVLGVGMVVKDWAKRGEIVTLDTISTVLTKLMTSKEGAEVQRKAKELGSDVRKAVQEGGVTKQELDSFIAHLNRE